MAASRLIRAVSGVTPLLLWACLGCDGAGAPGSPAHQPPLSRLGPVALPDRETDPGWRIMTWNLEWFGHPQRGPGDEALQRRRVHELLRRTGAQLIALQEISDPESLRELVGRIEGYRVVVSDYEWTQKLGLVFDSRILALRGVEQLGGFQAAGRPPLQVDLCLRRTGQALRVVVIHAKARDDTTSHRRRAAFAADLADRLPRPPTSLILLGDFNDLLHGSITPGEASPYRLLLEQTALVPATGVLNSAGALESSSVHGQTIDHILLSADLTRRLRAGSVDVLQDEILVAFPDYPHSVSDHFPVTLTLTR